MSLTVKDFIEVLKTFPRDSEIIIGYDDMSYDDDFLLGIVHDSEYNYEMPSCSYDTVQLCVLKSYHQNYPDLIYEEHELFGDKIWYNTEDYIDTWDCKGNRTKLFFDKETKKFIDWDKKMEDIIYD